MSATLSFRVITPDKDTNIGSLKNIFKEKYQLDKGPTRLSNIDLEFLQGVKAAASGELLVDIRKLLNAIENNQVVEIFLEY